MTPLPQSASVTAQETEAFRRFNRAYTKLIGTLNEGLLESNFSLAEARVLYELANRQDSKAGEIAAELAMDPGYLSRLLKKFVQNGLLQKEPSRLDARAAILPFTAKGRAAFKKLNTRSEAQARSMLGSLPPSARREVLRGMQSIEHNLIEKAPQSSPLILRAHRVGDMGQVIHSESIGYAQQFGWNESFEALVAKIVSDFLINFDPSRERCWIAERDGHHLGHIFLVRHPTDPATAKLRLLYVEPAARGARLGDILVQECLRFARTAGYSKVVLWTQSMLTSAHRIYAKAGFQLVKEEPHHSFGHPLVSQEWELDLT